MNPGVSVLVLHYNDFGSSRRCLSALYGSLPGYAGETELILIDNGSGDDSVEKLKKEFPELRVMRFEDNLQVGKSFAKAAEKAKYGLIYITPNDMEVKPGFLEPLVRHFKDERVFAANPMADAERKNERYMRNVGKRRFGLFGMHREDADRACYSISPTILGVFDRKKFLELGGPDSLYHPTFYDDYDLGMAAWKRGWRIVYEPSSVVVHHHKGQLKSVMGEREAGRIDMRNRHLFIWKNYDNVSLLFYALYLPAILVLGTLKRGPDYMRSFLLALGKLGEVRQKREREEGERKFSDKEIFDMSLKNVGEL